MNRESSFTLIELLIVIGILAVLSTVAVLALNPQELIKQARDSQRMADLATLNKVLAVYQSSGQTNLGNANTVYVSIPSNQANCSDLGLPTLPTGYTYACVPSSTPRNVNGTGWIPLSFTSVSYGTPLEKLPVDPINSTTTRNYYTYVMGGSWELTTAMESAKYKMGGSADKTSSDGGQYPGLYEEGTNLTLLPVDYGDPSLVGYWKFDEGSGTTVNDLSGSGNAGAMYAGATYPNPATTLTDFHTSSGCKSGSCASFNGTSDCVSMANSNNLNFGTGSFSISLWFNTASQSNDVTLIEKSSGSYGTTGVGYFLFISAGSGNVYSRIIGTNGNGPWMNTSMSSLIDGRWHHVIFVFTQTSGNIYVDGINKAYATNNSYGSIGNSNVTAIGRGSLNPDYGACASERIMNGLIDDVRIYNRTLSAAEVAAIYNATK